MGYSQGILQLIKDNGIIMGSYIMANILSQRFIGIPKEKIYRYKSKK
jgi:hypothetical protein